MVIRELPESPQSLYRLICKDYKVCFFCIFNILYINYDLLMNQDQLRYSTRTYAQWKARKEARKRIIVPNICVRDNHDRMHNMFNIYADEWVDGYYAGALAVMQ